MTPADRLALALCRAARPTTGPCPPEAICPLCRRDSQVVTQELAAILRDRHGHSTTADWLEAVGSHATES